MAMDTLWTSLSFALSCVSVTKRSTNPSNVPASTVPFAARRSKGSGSRAAASSKLVDRSLLVWLDPVDVDPTLGGLLASSGFDGGVMCTCSKRRSDASLEEDEDDARKIRGGRELSDQSG